MSSSTFGATAVSRPADSSRPRLDRKLTAIAAGSYTPDDFVIADAKDADMAFGVTAAGPQASAPVDGVGAGRHRSRADYLDAMRCLIAQGVVDVMLTSAANGEQLARDGSLDGQVTLAVRANDTTDIWNVRGGSYSTVPSRPFRSVHLPAILPFCDLVLYSVTFNNDLEYDLATLEAYGAFRREAAALGIRHFLEVFNPNAATNLVGEQVGAFVNDSIVRALAGVTSAERPLFLKMAYNGPRALGELVSHDPSQIIGILGGAAGTTRDTFELVHRAQEHGARVALFGRKIQRAESQLDLVGLMRPVLRDEVTPEDAVRAYHAALGRAEIAPHRTLDADLELTDPALRDQ
ncbi:MAG: hypothetical protein ACR2KJ_17715 [Jatrophihabitans sp.]